MAQKCIDMRHVLFGMEQNLAQRLIPKHLLQDHPRIKRDVLVLVSRESGEQDLGFCDKVLHGRRPGTNLST